MDLNVNVCCRGEAVRKELVKNALAIWAENIDVKTLEGRKRITDFFTTNKNSSGKSYWGGAHLAKVSTDGIFDDKKRFGEDGQYCGLFIAYCGLGIIQPDICHYVLPSTARAASAIKWKEAGVEKPAKVDFDDIRPGDIITVVTTAQKSYGDHFALVLGRKGQLLETVEGNATGILASGKRGRGVVKGARDVKSVRCVYRLDERHFLPQGVC